MMGGGFPELRVIYKMQEEVFKMKSKVMKRRMVIFNSSLFFVTFQKKQQIQTMKRLKNEANAAKVEADQREFGLNSQNLLLTAFMLWPSYNGHFLGCFFWGSISPSRIDPKDFYWNTIQRLSSAHAFLLG
jgi:hypothetical protein